MSCNTIAWKNGQWLPFEQAQLVLDDWGVLQGAIIVDRLRTIDTRPLDIDLHLERLKSNCTSIGIAIEDWGLVGKTIIECTEQNQRRLPQRDFAIVVLMTPGQISMPGVATTIVHVQPLKWGAMRQWYALGQHLLISKHRNVPGACWSPNLKTRSRLQYYLADQEASSNGSLNSAAVLLDMDGHLTETSAANILCVDRDRRLVCPPSDSILNGISLHRTLRLAESLGIEVVRQPITVELAKSASEIILTGTSACIWPASQFDQIHFEKAIERPVYRALLAAWIADVGFDFVREATSEN